MGGGGGNETVIKLLFTVGCAANKYMHGFLLDRLSIILDLVKTVYLSRMKTKFFFVQASLLEGSEQEEMKENERQSEVQCVSVDLLVQVSPF